MIETTGVRFEARSVPAAGGRRARWQGRTVAAALAAVALSLATPTPTVAQVAPSASFHPSTGTGATSDPNVSPTGGYRAAVPLDLPSPRGKMSVPLSVVYTGLTRAGAAGSGWDIPLSYVAWQRPQRNRPMGESPTSATPRRLMLSMGGSLQRLVKLDPFKFVPYVSDSYMELAVEGDGWSLRTLDNLRYRFTPIRNILDEAGQRVWEQPELWLLTEVHDTIGGDKIVIEYDTIGLGDCKPDVRMKSLSYTFTSSGEPLYQVQLAYDGWWRPSGSTTAEPCAGSSTAAAASPFDRSFDDHVSTSRTTMVTRIDVLARNNLVASSSLKAIRSYRFRYEPDRDTDKPRLAEVTLVGEDGLSTLPVATYEYGGITEGTPEAPTVTFAGPVAVPRSADLPEGFRNDVGDSLDWSHVLGDWPHGDNSILGRLEFSSTNHLIRDLTGDGLPDELWKSDETWHMVTGRVTATGLDLAGPATTWSEPSQLFLQSTFRFIEPTVFEAWAKEHAITTEVWSQLVDWNGDGRLDVVDARGGEDEHHWKVWINRPGAGAGIAWTQHQVDVRPILDHLNSIGLSSITQLAAPLFTGETWLDWPDQVPLARSKSWPRVRSNTCRQQECPGWPDPGSCTGELEECDSWMDYGVSAGSDTISEWSLVDANQDGFSDLVAQTGPTRVCDDLVEPGDRRRDPRLNNRTSNHYEEYRTPHSEDLFRGAVCGGPLEEIEPGITGTGAVAFLNRHGAFYGSSTQASPFADQPLPWRFAEHSVGGSAEPPLPANVFGSGAEHEEYGQPGSMGQEGYSYQYIGFSDPWSEGRLGAHYAAAASRWGRANVFKTNRRKNCPISAEHFTTAQVSGSYDLNGDGLLDLIESLDGQQRSSQTWDDWQVRFNTGAGFGAARPISMASHNRFMLSEVLDYCSSTSESDPSVYGGLMDLDADGLPEVYHVWGKELARSSIQMAGEAGGAGRLIAIENGYGARTTIHYANAKLDPVTTHHVPFPEIVVSHVETTVLDGSGPGLAPVHYRYGNATMAYDAMSARWTFPGYRWQLVLAGHPWTKDEVTTVTGVLTRYEYDEQAAPPISQFVEKVVRGRLAKVSRLEGSFDLPSLHQFLPPANGAPFAETTFTYAVRKEALTAEPESNLDCALDYPVGDTFTVTDLCRARGYVYQQAIRAWEGTVPSVNHSTEAGGQVLAIDAWGRPTSTHDQGDLRRTDDDVCTLITYGNGAPFPSVVTSVTLTDCIVDGTSRILARSRFLYDNQPFGSVTVGRLTQRWVDRYDATGFLGTFLDESYTYDGFGEIATAVSVRTLGGASTRTIGFLRDGFGASITSTSETASDVGRTFTKTIQASTWPSRGASSIDQAGIKTAVELDAFGRPRRETVEASGNRWTLRQITYPTDPADRKIIVDTFPGNTPAGSEASAPRQRTTTLLDALGRARFTQSELGSSYAQQTIVSDLVARDDLGRVVFAAAPFATSAQLFDPGSPAFLPYGTTVMYDARGRTTKVVEANGWNDGATATSVAGKVYVSTTSYQYAQGQSVVGTRGADANDPSSPRFGHVDQAYRSALGRETRRVRKDAAGAMLDVIDQTFDRLGRVTMTTRYGDPTSMTGVTVWKSHYDSLGRRMRLDEPSVSPMISTFDEDGNELETAWQDGTTRRVTRTAYDGFGRVTSQTLASTLIGQPETVESHDLYHYDVRAGDGDEPLTDGSVLLGRLAWAENPAVGKVYFGYDGFGRGNAEVYEYSGHGVVRQESALTTGGVPTSLTLTTPQTTDVISYVHDSAWRTRQVKKGSTALFDAVNVTALGQYENVKYGNGVTEKFTHDPVGRREQQKWMAYTAGGTYSFETLTRDGAGRVTEERHTTPTTASTYHATFDSLGRLATRLQSGGIVPGLEMFTYDGLGNFKTRTSTTGSGNRTYTTEPADRDRLCRYAPPGGSACLFKYDGAGNVTDDLTQPTTRSFTYDAGQRIREITKGASKVTMTYGPVGRMKTVVGGPNARTVWRFGGAIEERKRTDGVVQIERMIGGPLGAIASLRTALNASGAPTATETIYTHGDGRANRLFTRSNGAVVQAPTYASFGATTSGTSSGDPLTSTDDLWNGGDNLPEVGLVILGPRAYDPEMGRFLQRDPISVLTRSTTGNPYAFAFSDPINYADPTGLQPAPSDCLSGNCSGSGNSPNNGGGVDFGSIAITNLGYSLAKHILGRDNGSEGPHASVAVGASTLELNPGGIVGPMFRNGTPFCDLGCLADSAISDPTGTLTEMQIGSGEGGLDFLVNLAHTVRHAEDYLDFKGEGASVKMVLGIIDERVRTAKDPLGTFCAGGCKRGLPRYVTRTGLENFLLPWAANTIWGAVIRKLGTTAPRMAIRPERGYTTGKKHGVDWTEGASHARTTGTPQGKWSQADLTYAGEMAATLAPGQSAYFPLPQGPLRVGQQPSIVYHPTGTVVRATGIWIRNNGTGTFHGYPIP